MLFSLGLHTPICNILNGDKGFDREKPNQNEMLLKELIKFLALAEYTAQVFKKRVREMPQKEERKLYNKSNTAPHTAGPLTYRGVRRQDLSSGKLANHLLL